MSLFIGVDLGGTNIAVGAVDKDGRLLSKVSAPTLAPRGAHEICQDISKLCIAAAKQTGATLDQIAAIGVGSPGIISDGVIKFANNLKFVNEPLANTIGAMTNKPTTLFNDGSAAAYGELVSGAGVGKSSLIAVTLGTGIGGGIVVNGKILEGFRGGAGEIGHMIIDANGRQCSCGNKGCFEAYCSASALTADTRAAMNEDKNSIMWELCNHNISLANGKTAFDGAAADDQTACRVVEQYISHLAMGIHSLISLFAPEVICIGGGVSREGERLIDPLNKQLNKMSIIKGESHTQIKVAQLGNNAGIIGAAMLAAHKVV